jgi:hypothetical protein
MSKVIADITMSLDGYVTGPSGDVDELHAWVTDQDPVDEHSTRVAELLHEAAETHHQVFRITEGADDDWASWYSEWLVTLSELPELLGAKVVRSELVYLLVRLDKEYRDRHPAERWEDYYARELVRHYHG